MFFFCYKIVIINQNKGQIIMLDKIKLENKDLEVANLTEEKKAHLLEISKNIDFHDVESIQAIGNEELDLTNNISDKMISNDTKIKDLGVLGEDLKSLAVQLSSKENDPKQLLLGTEASQPQNFFAKLFRKGQAQLQEVKLNMQSVSNNIDSLSSKLDASIDNRIKDNELLKAQLDITQKNVMSLTDKIEVVKLKLSDVIDHDLKEKYAAAKDLKKDSNEYFKAKFDIQETEDLVRAMDEQLITLMSSRMIAENTQNQTYLNIQANKNLIKKTKIVQKQNVAQWKNSVASTLLALNTLKQSNELTMIIDASENAMIKANKTINDAAYKVAELNGRPTISIETIKTVQNDTLDTVVKISEYTQKLVEDRQTAKKELIDLKKSGEELSLIHI